MDVAGGGWTQIFVPSINDLNSTTLPYAIDVSELREGGVRTVLGVEWICWSPEGLVEASLPRLGLMGRRCFASRP